MKTSAIPHITQSQSYHMSMQVSVSTLRFGPLTITVCYVKPRTDIEIILQGLHNMFNNNPNCAHIVMGDFNVDLASSSGSRATRLVDYFHQHMMRSAFTGDIITTRGGTFIDAIFTTFQLDMITANPYISMSSSYHLPLYLRAG